MSSDLSGILVSAMTVTCGSSKGIIGKYMVTGTVAVETARSMSLLSAGMGSASEIGVYMGADVIIRGGGRVVG